MFTGIIQDIGSIKLVNEGLYEVNTNLNLNDIKKGSSISCNGVCLTAIEIKKNNDETFSFKVNIGEENQKSGINQNEIKKLFDYSKEIGLDVIGLMCIPPANINPEEYFKEMNKIKKTLGLTELSMGMSSDYLIASKHSSTYVRIGSSIFGQRY